MSTYPSLYEKLNKINKTQLKERSLLYPNLGQKVVRILENKDFVSDLTVGELADMNGMVTLNGEWLTSLNIYEYFEEKNKLISLVILSTVLFSCTKEEQAFIPLCPDGECDAELIINYPQDEEGNYIVDLDWDGEYWPRFDIEVLVDETSPEYHYNGEPHIIAAFDTDSYWIMGDSLSVTFPLYKPWVGLETQWGDPIPVGTQTIYLNQFAGQVLPLVQKSEIYFNEGYSKRIVGPVPPEFENDTIQIWMKVWWDGGVTVEEKTYLEKFIIK